MQAALTEKLAADKGLRAATSGFTAVLHTWNQRLEFHPHIHCLVPGAGLNATGDFVRVKTDQFLVYLPHLQAAFRQHFYELFKEHDWQVDPTVWSKQWGVHIQPAGSGTAAVKYLGTYVARTAITDARLLSVTNQAVTFRWKDRAHQNRSQSLTLPGLEFVAPLFATRAAQGIALRALLRLLPSHRKSLPLARATSFGQTFGLGSGASRLRFAIPSAARAFGSALSQMRRAHAVASLDKSAPEESRPTPSQTRSTANFFSRMNAARLQNTQHSWRHLFLPGGPQRRCRAPKPAFRTSSVLFSHAVISGPSCSPFQGGRLYPFADVKRALFRSYHNPAPQTQVP